MGVYLADVQGSSLYSKVAHGVLYTREQQERTVRRHRTDTIAEGIGLDRLTANFMKGLPEHNGGALGLTQPLEFLTRKLWRWHTIYWHMKVCLLAVQQRSTAWELARSRRGLAKRIQ